MSGAMDMTDNPLFLEKISIEPDLGDQRKSTWKALPAPPKTPKRIMMKYRFSAVFPFVFAAASFALTIVVVLSGQEKGNLGAPYLVALNTSRIGRDLLRFERATSTAAPASATSSATPGSKSSPTLFSANSSCSALSNLLDPIANNLTDAVDSGLDKLVDAAAEELVERAGIADFYYLYLQTVCSGWTANSTGGNADGIIVEKCESWSEAHGNIAALKRSIQSSIVIGRTNVSIPLLTKLPSSLDSLTSGLSSGRQALFAFLVVSLIGSALSALSVVPSIVFPHSRLLVYCNMAWACLASAFAFLGAMLATVASITMPLLVKGIGEAMNVAVVPGTMVVWFTWLAWFCASLPLVYWSAVWFVETRKSNFVRRARSVDEMGYWGGIGAECWRDLRGRKTKPKAHGTVGCC